MAKRTCGARHLLLPLLALAVPFCSAACSGSKETAPPEGAGIGSMAGAASGDAEAAAGGVGTGVGYVIGDPTDEAKAKEMTARGTPVEVAPLGGTRWELVSLNTMRTVGPYTSKVLEFRPDAHVITTTTRPDGKVVLFDESYRVVGNTLIVNKPGYLVNARYRFEGDRLVVVVNARYSSDGGQLLLRDPGFSAVLRRMS
jgi:hypothetical protein